MEPHGLTIKRIESPSNPVIKETLSLVRKRSASSGGEFLIEGPHLFEEALSSRRVLLDTVFATEPFISENRDMLVSSIEGGGIELFEVSEKVMQKLSTTQTSQGIAALARYGTAGLEALPFDGISVILDGLQDPGNVGTIIRTAHAFGAQAAVLLPGTCDIFNPKALRATAGSVFYLPVITAAREELVAVLREKGVRLVIAEANDAKPLPEADLSPPIALVLGSEARGASSELRSAAEMSITIPAPGGAESLNVAQAAAIFLWEMGKRT